MATQPKLGDNTVFLIDGSGYIFRAFYAVRMLKTSYGLPTNAVFGFTNMLVKLIKEHNPKYLAIAFDRKEKTFRHKIYEDYKANRTEPPEELVPQFDMIRELVDALAISRLEKVGFEADDLLGTMAKKAKEEGHEVVIVTGDKDLMQLVDDKVFLLDELRASRIGSEQFIDAEEVKKEFDVFPENVVDLLALAGDSSDNVPGVAGIGKKTAALLINEFGSLEKILEMAPLIKQKSRREKIIEGHKMAKLSKELVTIDQEVSLEQSISDLKYSGVNKDALRDVFSKWEFTKLLKDKTLFGDDAEKASAASVPKEKTPSKTPAKKIAKESAIDRSKYLCIQKEDDLDKLITKLKKSDRIAIDTETDSLDSTTANLVGISLSWEENQAAYIPIVHSEEKCLSIDSVRKKLGPILSDDQKTFLAQNAKFDQKVLQQNGVGKFLIGGDPMLASYLLTNDQERHGLDFLSEKYLQHTPISYTEICGEKKSQIPFSAVPLDQATEYAAEDADLAWRLEKKLGEELTKENLQKLYFDLELPLEEVLARMELNGVCVDKNVLQELKSEFEKRLCELEVQAHEIAGESFNLASPKQVSEILFEKLKLKAVKKTKTGFSTDSSVLEKLSGEHELPTILLQHRMLAKLLNTYVETLPTLINPKTKRIHTSFNQFVTATGRLSSSDPNLQNIPVKTSEGRRIRQAFIAQKGSKLISLDYSQVELRILAFISKDPVMLDSFAKDQDVHRRTASEIFDVPQEKVTKEQRNAAKSINFGLLYGMGALRLAQTLGITRNEAQNYLQKYFDKYAGILAWKNQALKEAQENNEIRTLFGRKRSVPELSSSNPMLRARGERLAINTPIQGTAADIMKKAMIDTDRFLQEKFPSAKLILQVHDELVIEAKTDEAQSIADQVSKIMRHGHGLELDLKVEFAVADNWDDAH